MPLKSDEQLTKELSAPLPAQAVKPHPTKTFLSSIKAIYVTERLNQVFGIGGWSVAVQEIERGEKGMVVVKATIKVDDYDIYYECYGGNDNGGENSKNFDLGDAYKGATTDAITKIGSYLGIGIEVFKGLATAPQTKGENPELPWLNEKDQAWKDSVLALQTGTDLATIKKKFRISKDGEAKLLQQAKEVSQAPITKQLTATELKAHEAKINAIDEATGLSGYYNALSENLKSNQQMQDLLKARREAIKVKS